jgi:hypothetical protein
MKAVERILAYDQGEIDQHRDATWQNRRDNKYKGKPMPDNRLPEGTFKQGSPGGIANTLKNKSEDLDQAMRRLNNYTNGRGRETPSNERNKLEQTKHALQDAYGVKNDEDSSGPEKNRTNNTNANFQTSINAPTSVHNLDDSRLDTGLDSKPNEGPVADVRDPMAIGAITRLLED